MLKIIGIVLVVVAVALILMILLGFYLMKQKDGLSSNTESDKGNTISNIANILIDNMSAGDGPGIVASFVDANKVFTDPKVASFVNDIQRGRVKQVTKAIQEGIDVNTEGAGGYTPVFFVFHANNTEVLKILLEAGADIHHKLEGGDTLLHVSVRMKNLDFTKVLLEAGSDPNEVGESGKTVLIEAVDFDLPAQVEILVKGGADINMQWANMPPLFHATLILNWSVASQLLKLGADTSYKSLHGKTAADLFCEELISPNYKPGDESKQEIIELFDAFKKRGVTLTCLAEEERFK